MILVEVCYLVYFIVAVLLVGFAGFLAMGLAEDQMMVYESTTQTSPACEPKAPLSFETKQAAAKCKKAEAQYMAEMKADTLTNDQLNLGMDLFHVAIGMLIAYIFRLYYLCKLCGWVCCGKSSDTSKDRHGLVKAMWGFIISAVLSGILVILIPVIKNAAFDPSQILVGGADKKVPIFFPIAIP